jgi:hypothetical protein
VSSTTLSLDSSHFTRSQAARLLISVCFFYSLISSIVVTVLLMPQGPLKLTSYPWDATLVASEKKVQDEKIVDLLKTSIRPKKAKK